MKLIKRNHIPSEDYTLPENLRRFYTLMKKNENGKEIVAVLTVVKRKNKEKEKNIEKPKVAFICVHNSCRSQMAEAIAKILAEDAFEAFIAGVETKEKINQDAVKIIKELYNVDMEEYQYPKLTDMLPPIDIVITMGVMLIVQGF